MAYVNVACWPGYRRGISMIDAGWTVFLHEVGHNLGARHVFEHGGLMQQGGQHAYFAAPQSLDAICAGLSALKACPIDAASSPFGTHAPPTAPHTGNCDEVLVATESEVDAAAVLIFVLLLTLVLVVPFVVCSRDF